MRDWKVMIEIDMKKILIVALMVLATYAGVKTGMGDALLVVIPAGLACLASKEV